MKLHRSVPLTVPAALGLDFFQQQGKSLIPAI
jgi:predicted membrane-bound mannosyltransferase